MTPLDISEASEETETIETLKIIYQDDYLVAVNKPAGLLVHRSMIDRHETRFALQMVRNQVGSMCILFIGLINRHQVCFFLP